MFRLNCTIPLLSYSVNIVDDFLCSPTYLRWTSGGVVLLSLLMNFDVSRRASSPTSSTVHFAQAVEVAQTQRVRQTTNCFGLARYVCVCPYQTLQECSTTFFYCLSPCACPSRNRESPLLCLVTILSARRQIAVPVHKPLGFASTLESYVVRADADSRPMSLVAKSCTRAC